MMTGNPQMMAELAASTKNEIESDRRTLDRNEAGDEHHHHHADNGPDQHFHRQIVRIARRGVAASSAHARSACITSYATTATTCQ
jgi:hypothetical protein